eukprot:Phypoly_transcript_06617.p1 GENE.Phypoly_transcript_06617~~Phypoly_transcript_06617.p1  ORF type:complete len:547 (-),score=107.31 Phypoly_transcript_06617:7-1647(-)
MMESVVLDNVVFEDVIPNNDNNPFQTPADKESSPQHASKPLPVRHSETSSDNSSPSTHHVDTFSSSPFNESSSYITASSTLSADSSYVDTGAFAPPEYQRDSTSYTADSGFRETSFSSPEVPRASPAQRDVVPIDVVVTDPEKFGDGMNSYITYKIRTSASFPKYRDASVVVRRYNDFLWFHDQLRTNNKGVLIPPLPEKALINRFSTEFIETRRKELEKFLNRVVQHHILNRRPEVIFFLQSSDDQFNATKSRTAKPQPRETEQPPVQQQSSGGSGFGSFVSFLGHGIGHGIAAAANLTTATGTAREIDQWFDAKKNYVNALEAHLSALLKSASKLLTKRKELAAAHSDFASSISIVGSTEAETDSFLSTAFIRVGQISEHIKDLGEQLFRNESTHFEEALKDYLRVLGAVRDMLADRDEILLEYQNATRAYEAKREKIDKDKARGSSKAKGSERELDEAQRKVDETKREYEALSATVRAELEVFDTTRAREIRRMISLLVQSNMEHSLQVVDQWKSYISDTQGSDEKDWRTADKIGWGGVGNLR